MNAAGAKRSSPKWRSSGNNPASKTASSPSGETRFFYSNVFFASSASSAYLPMILP